MKIRLSELREVIRSVIRKAYEEKCPDCGRAMRGGPDDCWFGANGDVHCNGGEHPFTTSVDRDFAVVSIDTYGEPMTFETELVDGSHIVAIDLEELEQALRSKGITKIIDDTDEIFSDGRVHPIEDYVKRAHRKLGV